MKRIFWLFVLFVGFAIPVFSNDSGPAPDFTLKGVDGRAVTLSALKGKVVIIDFWATWCPPCREEIPGFVELYKQYKDQGLEIIGISVDNDEKKVKPFVEANGVNYPVVSFTKEVTEAYGGIQSVPTTFILDHQLNIVGKHVGFVELTAFKKEIEPLLKNIPSVSSSSSSSNNYNLSNPTDVERSRSDYNSLDSNQKRAFKREFLIQGLQQTYPGMSREEADRHIRKSGQDPFQ